MAKHQVGYGVARHVVYDILIVDALAVVQLTLRVVVRAFVTCQTGSPVYSRPTFVFFYSKIAPAYPVDDMFQRSSEALSLTPQAPPSVSLIPYFFPGRPDGLGRRARPRARSVPHVRGVGIASM